MANNVSKYEWCKFAKSGTIKVEKVENKEEPKATLKAKTKLKAKKPIKKKGNKARIKATDITKTVKEIVLKRDAGKCILCSNKGIPNAHYIKRSQGGLGIEQNIVCLCAKCHHEQDNGKDTELYTNKLKEYLKGKYENWNEKDLVYRKGV